MAKYARCVLIDDSKADLFIAKLIIKNCNKHCDIVELNNGEEALTWFNKNPGVKDTLVLLDINMPIMSGFEFLDEINHQSFHHTLDMYLLSSSTHPDDKEKAKAYDIVKSYIVKPINKETILALLN